MPKDTNKPRLFEAKLDNGETVWLRIRGADYREREAADFEFSRIYNLSLRHALPPRVRMLKELKESGLWTGKDSDELEEIRRKALEWENKVKDDKFETPEHKRRAEKKRDELTAEWNEARQDLEMMLAHTADGKADVAWRNFMIAATIEYADMDDQKKLVNGDLAGQRRFESVEELMECSDTSLVQRCAYEHIMFENGLPSDWESLSLGDEEENKEEDKEQKKEEVNDSPAEDNTTDQAPQVESPEIPAPAPAPSTTA